MTGDTGLIELDRFYLQAIAQVAKDENFDAVLQQIGIGKGKLYFIPCENSTRADVVLAFDFGDESVRFIAVLRSGQKLDRTVSYVEGIDEFVPELLRLMRSNRLTAPTSPKGRRAA